MKTEIVEFYVIVDKENLEFVRDENNTTKNIDKAMMFETKNEAFNDLYNYDDDVKNRYKVYKATREITTTLKLQEGDK